MEGPKSQPKATVLRTPCEPMGAAEVEVVRPGVVIDDPAQAHCADHAHFHAECATCKRACANLMPYPVRKDKPAARSFGFKDDLTEAKLRALDPRVTNLYRDETDFSLSLSIVRLLMKMIWPFRRW